MLWSDTQATYLDAVDSVTALVPQITDYAAPGLGAWDVRGLTGHLLRALRTPLTYLAEPEPRGDPLPDAAAYYERYLRQRKNDPTATDRTVEERGSEELASASPAEISHAFATAASELHASLPAVAPPRRLQTPMGVMHIEDYLRTRNLEVVVHGADLSRATAVPWHAPDSALRDSFALLTEIATQRGGGVDLLMVLTGRPPGSPPLPILR